MIGHASIGHYINKGESAIPFSQHTFCNEIFSILYLLLTLTLFKCESRFVALEARYAGIPPPISR